MTTKRKSLAQKQYRVIADATQLVFQTVTATSPEEAYEIASENDDEWEYDGVDESEYRVFDEVEDVATGEMVHVQGVQPTHCETCGCEIDAWNLGMPLEKALDHRLAEVRGRAEMKRTMDSYPRLRAEQKIRLAIEILWDVTEHWDHDNLEHYPESLPSLDEYIAEISGPLYEISFKYPSNGNAA